VSELAIDVLCASILENIRSTVSPECFRTWFKDLNVQSVENRALNLIAPNRYVKQWLESHYRKELLSAAASLVPEIASINITVRVNSRLAPDSSSTLAQVLNGALPASVRNGNSSNGTHAHASSTGSHSNHRRTPLAANLRLETFLVGRCNRVAHAAAQSVAETPAAVYNPLFIHGAHGLGKTHLLQGIGHLLKERIPTLCVGYISCEEFTNAYVTGVQNKRLDAFRSEFRTYDALLIDDVQFLAGKDKTQEEFLHTFDSLRQSGRQVVLSADAAPRDIKRLDPKLVTRFQSGLVARLETPEVPLRTELLREKARVRGLNLAVDVAELMATHIESNVRELEGAICKLMALAAAEARPPDRELAIVSLRELGYIRSGPLTLADILAAVTQRFAVSADEIRSGKRHASLVHARHVGMYLSKALTSQSVAEIGRFYGNRDHATVLHATQKLSELLKRDENLKLEIQALRQVLGR
jgi:chromosomal replication initiator protein